MSTITNVAKVLKFEVIFQNVNIVGICISG